jgi:polyisoprenoid-binding protein YceI
MRRERGVTTPMRRRLSLLVAAALLLGAWSGEAAPVRFVVEPEKSQVAYVSGTQLGEFRGDTTAVGGEILMDPQDPSRLRLAVSADLRQLKSDNARRDQHMYEQVLEVARFPKATFTAGEFRPSGAGDGQGVLVGTFALHGVERVVSVPIRFKLEGNTLRGDGTFTIALTNFGMTPPRLLGLKVRDQAVVEIRLVGSGR